MRDKARVLKIEGNRVQVVPLLSDTCINCAEAICAKRGTPFWVTNSKKLPVFVGASVKISASVSLQIFQAFFALIFPIGAAVFGYWLPGVLFSPVAEKIRVGGVFLCFGAAVTLVLVLSRLSLKDETADISEVFSS